MTTKRPNKTPWLHRPFTFRPFFDYATGVEDATPRRFANVRKPDKGEPPETPITTMAVGEEGDQGAPPPGPPGTTTPAIGEEGAGNVPTTTIAKGEEGR